MKEKQGKKSFKKAITLGVTGAILSSTLLAPASALASEKRSSQPIATITTTSINYNDLINKIQTPQAAHALQLDVLRQMDQNMGHQKNFIPFSLIKKAVVAALRYGGPMLSKIVKNVSPKAAKWIDNNSWALANKLDEMTAWTEGAISMALVAMGAPPDVAVSIARALMLLV